MLDFIVLTISITVAILLASGLSVFLLVRPVVMKWYMKKVMKTMPDMQQLFEEELMKDL